MTHTCPICRGYRLERQWCDFCNGTGQVPERRQSQRRKQGRRDGDDLLAEAGRIIKSWIEEEGYPAHIPDDEVDALLEKINDR